MFKRTPTGSAVRPIGLMAPATGVASDLERHLARCRRSGLPAALLVARLDPAATFPDDLQSHLRLADSALLAGPGELLLLCDAPSGDRGAVRLDREALERRLRTLAAVPLRCGWASFPDDGLAASDLLRHARAATDAARPGATAPSSLLAVGT